MSSESQEVKSCLPSLALFELFFMHALDESVISIIIISLKMTLSGP